MDKKILFNIASRSRPEKFWKLIYNIEEMCDNENYLICAKVDSDDTSMMWNGQLIHVESMHPKVDAQYGMSKNKIHAINRDIPVKGYQWDIIVDLSDDFVITRKGFDNIIRQHCGPDDCLHFPEPFATKQNSKNKNDNIIIMAVMGRDYYNRFGYIYNPVYKSLFCDNELTAVAKKLGRYKFVNEDIFYHAHPAAGYGKADAQTRHTESFWKEDEAVYLKRKSEGFPL